jgi:endo-1,4-beta-xylanase
MKSSGLKPAIYVFVNGGPVSHYNMPEDDRAQGASVFIDELIPHVDRKYRTIADRSGRALEGFSQGGRGTMRLALRHPDVFCSAAAGGGGYATEKRISESGGVESPNLRFAEGDNTWDLARGYAGRSRGPDVRWMIYVGTKGFNYENNLEYMDFLSSLGIEFERLVVAGVPHSATGIYAKAAERIMRFHVRNFEAAQSK